MPTIEPATVADAPALAHVFVRCWQDAYRNVVADEIVDALDPEAEERRWRILVGLHRVLVVRSASAAVGMVRFGPDEDDPDRGHVYSLYVDPAAAGAGLGRSLLARAREELGAAGFRLATLWVFAANERALRFYAADGWRATGVTRVEPEWQALELQLAAELC